MPIPFKKKLFFIVEGILFCFVYGLLRLMPLRFSKAFCAFLLRTIGPKTGAEKIGAKNLAAAFPNYQEQERQTLLKQCWHNLGLVIGEFAHVPRLVAQPQRFTVQGLDKLEPLIKNKGGIFFAAHLGNWEISYAPLAQKGYHINLIARVHQNPFLNWFIELNRNTPYVRMISRNKKGSRALIEAIRKKELIGALVDQYATDGAFIDFFNRPAKTTLGLARMAIKHNLPFIPVQVIRIQGTSTFKVIFHSPLAYDTTKDPKETAEQLMIQANQLLEQWIRQHPSQWLWLHNRWKQKPKRLA